MFDTQEYKWKQVEFPLNFQKPSFVSSSISMRPLSLTDRQYASTSSARSGFSLLPCPEGVVLHGGYVKRFEKGKRAKGVALDDTWLLRCVSSSLTLCMCRSTVIDLPCALPLQHGRHGHDQMEVGEASTRRLPSLHPVRMLDDALAGQGDGCLFRRRVRRRPGRGVARLGLLPGCVSSLLSLKS